MNTLNERIAMNVMGWIRFREEEYPHRDGFSMGDHGRKCLAVDMPDYSGDGGDAMTVLTHCMKNLDRLTGRTDFQIVVLYDEGSINRPYCVTTDSTKDEDDDTHVRNCASAETMELAICRFAENLYANSQPERGTPPQLPK